jgi:hypothetical protein
MADFRVLLASAMGVAALGVAGCASTGEEAVMASAEGEGSDSDIICRRVHEVGSRLSSRQCKTREEWDREAEEAREAMERNDGRGIGDPGGPVFGPGF